MSVYLNPLDVRNGTWPRISQVHAFNNAVALLYSPYNFLLEKPPFILMMRMPSTSEVMQARASVFVWRGVVGPFSPPMQLSSAILFTRGAKPSSYTEYNL